MPKPRAVCTWPPSVRGRDTRFEGLQQPVDGVALEVGRIEVGRIEVGRIEVGRIEVGRIEAAQRKPRSAFSVPSPALCASC